MLKIKLKKKTRFDRALAKTALIGILGGLVLGSVFGLSGSIVAAWVAAFFVGALTFAVIAGKEAE